jgi:hypothetical protein
LSQIIEENRPDGLNVVVLDVAARIDAVVAEVAFTGWRESIPGDRAVKKELRGVLKQSALPVTAELFDRDTLRARKPTSALRPPPYEDGSQPCLRWQWRR